MRVYYISNIILRIPDGVEPGLLKRKKKLLFIVGLQTCVQIVHNNSSKTVRFNSTIYLFKLIDSLIDLPDKKICVVLTGNICSCAL